MTAFAFWSATTWRDADSGSTSEKRQRPGEIYFLFVVLTWWEGMVSEAQETADILCQASAMEVQGFWYDE